MGPVQKVFLNSVKYSHATAKGAVLAAISEYLEKIVLQFFAISEIFLKIQIFCNYIRSWLSKYLNILVPHSTPVKRGILALPAIFKPNQVAHNNWLQINRQWSLLLTWLTNSTTRYTYFDSQSVEMAKRTTEWFVATFDSM